MKAKVSKMAMLLLVLCMTISMFSVNVSAEDATTPIDSCDRIVEPYDLDNAEDYINDNDASTYPTCKTEGYIFAGWYTKETCTEDSYWGHEEQGEPGDTVYALFVPSHVLGVRAQISSNLINGDTSDDNTASIRFITTVDTLLYRQTGFEISYIGSDENMKSTTSASNKVYKRLYAIGSTTNEDAGDGVLEYTAEGTFCGLSTYFKACTVKNIGSDYYTTAFAVKPFWKTMDGSKVYGETVVKSINDYFLESDVYVSSQMETAADTVENGSAEKPFETLEYALGMVANGGTIHVVDSYAATSSFVWKDHNKTVTITGGTIDFTGVPKKTIGSAEETVLDINDSVTFTGTTLTFANGQHIYANGNSVELASDVTWGDSSAYVQIYGGAYNTTLNSDTNLVLSVGNYTRVVGGNNKGTLNGDTHVTLKGTINGALATNEVYKEHETNYVVYGAGENDGKLNGDANLTIASETVYFQYVFGGGNSGAVNGDCHVTYTGKAMSVYGGGKSGKITGNTYLTMTGGWVEQVFGGAENANIEGNTNVHIQGGTVKRRVYGGCYNNASGTVTLTWSSTPRKVTGHTNVSIGPDATFTLDYQHPDYYMKVDNSIYSISRYKTTLEKEWGAFIFNANSYDKTYKTKLGYHDSLHSGYYAEQSYHYLITTNGNTEDGAYGTVSSENNYIRIEPNSGYSATVTVKETGEKYYTESDGVFKLPELTATTDTRNIEVTFGVIDSSADKSGYEAKIDGAYYDTLEEAVDAAQVLESEDTITVTLLKDAEVEKAMAITDSSNVEVEGANKYTIHRADTMRNASIFTIEDGCTLTVDNVLLDGRTTTDISSNITDLDTLAGSTSSLIYNDGTVHLQNVTAQYAVKTEVNGAVLQSWGKDDVVTVDNSTFSYNKAPGQGAAIRMGGGTAKLEVRNSTFEYNKVYTLTSTEGETVSVVAKGQGGAIGTHAATANIENSKFVGNTATGYAENNDAYAGAIYSATNSIVTMTGSDENALFSGNSVTNGHGGAVTAESGKVTITGYTFTTNTSTGNGGAILSQGKTTKIKSVSCTFKENTATGNGGVAYVAGSGTLIFDEDTNCAVEALAKDNEAGAYGGVTAQGSNTVVKVTGYKFEGNSAQYGGAVRVNADALSATIKNTEFVSNTATQPGGAIQSYSLLSVTGSTFIGNTSGNAGGAIHNVGNGGSINDCTFTSNTSATNGGAICTDTAITVNNSTFTGNEANKNSTKTNGGGAIFTGNNIVITIDKCAFSANKSVGAEDSFGGAIYMKKGTLKMDSANGTTFTSNTATHGGAIYMTTGTATINNSEFNLNESVWPGGAIYSNGSLSVTGSTFEENESTRGIGGAVKLDGSASGQFADVDFMENHAGNAGGAIHNAGNNITINTCTFTNNTSVNAGGAVNTDKAMTITSSTFTSNVSSNGNGGAFYNGKNVVQTITGCDFVSDSAVSGGAIYLNDGTMTATDCEFYGNTSTKEGGAVWTNASTTTIKNSIFGDTDRGNSTATNGGALYIAETKTVNVDNSTFKANTAVNGGAIECHNSTLKATSCQFIGNEATTDDVTGFVGRGGGAVNITGNAKATFDGAGTFESNTAATGHGGAIYTTDAELSITGYTFTSNSASRAGAIMIDNVTEVVIEDDESTKEVDETEYDVLCTTEIIINDSKFVQNHSDEHGGAIYTKTRTLKLTKASADALFDRNTSDSLGGAVCSNGSPIIVQGYRFDTNSASEGGAIWSNNALTVNDSTFNANTTTGVGGAIEHSGATGRIEGTTFSNNIAGNAGGAIINKGTNTSVSGCTFTSNTSATNGGAICTDTALTVDNSTFTSNKANGTSNKGGGAIFTGKNIAITINNSEFTSNKAAGGTDSFGGAVYMTQGTLYIMSAEGTTFTSNTATHGGAIYMTAGTAIINNSEFRSNESVWHGGAFNINGSLTVTGSVLEKNKSTKGIGGAIKLNGNASGKFEDTDFIQNSAANAGGAIHNEGKNITINEGTFEGNTSVNSGGAINTNTAMTITSSTFTSNASSNGNGGAFYNGKNVAQTITGCDFVSDSAVSGGAIYLNDGTMTATDCEFYGNTSTKEGGAVWTNASTTTIKNSFFGDTDRGNSTATNGGALYIAETKTVNVDNTTFKANTAVNGGAIECHNSTLNATSCHFIGNTATTEDVTGLVGRGGGAVNITGNAKATFGGTGTFESNTAATGHGGAIYTTDAELSITGYTFTSNSASRAGAIMIDNVAEVVIEDDESTKDVDETEYDELCTTEIIINDSKFVQNHSDEHGGAIYTKTRTLKLTKASADALFDRNTSDSLGGAVCSNGSPIIVQGYRFDTNSASEGGAIWSNNVLTVNDSTFNANTTTGVGGAIEHSGATGRIEGTIFSNNTAGNAGGAIINKGTNTSVIDCTFTSNTTATNGGAICTDRAITITGTEFTSNKAGGGNDKYGGAIYTGQNIQITIDDCGFTSNSATHGGAIYMATGTGIITDSEFKLNESVWHGGTIYANGSLDVTGTTFDGNKTTSGIAGAIRVESKGTGRFQNCQFLNNQAGNAGGAIHNAGANTTVSSCTFNNNSAVNNGGAICTDKAITIAGSEFTGNQAKGTSSKGGGAIYTNQNIVVTIDNSTFTSNKASGGTDSFGGAIYMTQGTLKMDAVNGSTFTSNTATHGGAIYMTAGTATITNSEFDLNESVWPGGAVYSKATLNITGSDFEGNKSTKGIGGAIKLEGSASKTITDCDFIANEASNGGAIHEQGASISISRCLFERNKAYNGKGGAINAQTGTDTIDTCTFTGNTSTSDGKAIYFENGTMNLKNSIFNAYASTDIYIKSGATLNEENNTKN